MDDEQFRAMYMASGSRMMMGIATDEYRAEAAREQEILAAAAAV